MASQISVAKTTGSNDRYEHYEWNFVNTTDYLTITGPSPARTITLPPMMCFIVTFTPSSAPAGMGFQLNYTFQAEVGPIPTPTSPPNASPSDEANASSDSKVGFAFDCFFLVYAGFCLWSLYLIFLEHPCSSDAVGRVPIHGHCGPAYLFEVEARTTHWPSRACINRGHHLDIELGSHGQSIVPRIYMCVNRKHSCPAIFASTLVKFHARSCSELVD